MVDHRRVFALSVLEMFVVGAKAIERQQVLVLGEARRVELRLALAVLVAGYS